MAFTCSGILYLCFESLGLDITSVILNCFKKAATYLLFFLLKNYTNDCILYDTICFWSKKFYPFRQLYFFAFGFETCSTFWIFTSKISLRSWNSLLTGTNPRSLPLINESRIYARASSCTIPKNGSPSDIEQTMSSQEHLHWYIKSNGNGGCKNPQQIYLVLQVARCFLPHRFKRSFTITFLYLSFGIWNRYGNDSIWNHE